MARTTHDWIGATLASGRYHVRAKLGEGGMGYVFRAHDRNLDADVVVKAPRRAMLEEPEFADRFAREVKSLVKLAHPHVLRVTDVGEHEGVPFAVMPYLSGGSLAESLEVAKDDEGMARLLDGLARWLPGVSQALDYVHSRGYVHRDVKPGNILFDEHGHVLLSDFGVAKVLSDAPGRTLGAVTTGMGLVLGTPEYMAPECVMGQAFDGRIDQYALGITVYEVLSGRRPLEGASASAVFVLQSTKVPEPLAMVEPRVPRAISEAVARALAKEPGERFATCTEFARTILAGLDSSEGNRTPSGRFVKSDQVWLPCPVCERSLILPKTLLADPERAARKRLTCPACRASLRIPEGSKALVAIDKVATEVASSAAPFTLAEPKPGRGVAGGSLTGTVAMKRGRAGLIGRRAVVIGATALLGIAVAAGLSWLSNARGLGSVAATSVESGRLAGVEGEPEARAADEEPRPVAMDPTEATEAREGAKEPAAEAVVANDEATSPAPVAPSIPPSPPGLPVAGPQPPSAEKSRFAAEIEGPPREGVTLADVYDHPEEFKGQLVVLKGFVRLGTPAEARADGTTWAWVSRAQFRTVGSNLSAIENLGATLQFQVDELLYHWLQEDLGILRQMKREYLEKPENRVQWPEALAVVTLHVRKRTAGDGDPWVPTIVKVEYVTSLDLDAILARKKRDLVMTLVASPHGIERPAVSRRTDMAARLGDDYLGHARKVVGVAKMRTGVGVLQKQMNAAMSRFLK